MRICILILLSLVLVGCSSQQSYECLAGDERCKISIEWAENMAIIEQLQDIVGEKCNFPTKDESYEFWKMEREQRKQYMISCNELIVREQYSDELLSK